MRYLFSGGCVFLLLAGCSGQQGSQPRPPAVAELIAMLKDQNPQTQLTATGWIVELGPKAAETAPALTTVLKSPHAQVRQSAALALGKIGPENSVAIPALTAALSDVDHGVRRSAADTLGQIGPTAQSAIPALVKMSKQTDPCNSAETALKRIRQ